MRDHDSIDFQPNSVGVMIVRVVRLKDIVTALNCTEDFARDVVREIRGETSEDGTTAFVLPSQLAAWAYKRAGKPAAPFPSRTLLVKDGNGPADALTRANGRSRSTERTAPLALSYRKAAAALDIGLTELKNLVRDGTIRTKAYAPGKHPKIPVAEIQRLTALDPTPVEKPRARPMRHRLPAERMTGSEARAALKKL